MSADSNEVEDLLSDAEREAMSYPLDDEPPVDQEDEPPKQDEEAKEAVPAGDATPDATPDAEEAAEAAPAVERKALVYRADMPNDLADQIAKLNEDETSLADKYEKGEIDFAEFRAQSSAINDRRLEISTARIKAEISAEMTKQTAEQEWQHTIDVFMARAKREGIDYAANAAMQKDLDVFVKALANDDANADKSMSWFLEEAHTYAQAKHGMLKSPPTAANPTATRKPNLKAIPPSLSSVPNGQTELIGDEFASLDGLVGEELEDAYRRLTPSQKAKYLHAA